MNKNQSSLDDAKQLTSTCTVLLGTTVVVRDEAGEIEKYCIVARHEVEPLVRKISGESPVGRSLLGHKVGDAVTVAAPMGQLRLVILDIK